MRVLAVGNMYPPHHQGGYERVWAAATDELRARGHDVEVLTTTHREPGVERPDPPWVRRELQWYWEDHAFRPLGLVETLRLERHNARVLDAAAPPDLVMWWAMGGMSLSLIARARRRLAPAPSMAVVHDAWPVYAPKFDRWTARYGRLAPHGWRYEPGLIDHWSFNSAYSRDLLGRGGVRVDPARCSVEYPGVDTEMFGAVEPRPWRWRLAYVGRVEARKGLETALRTLAALPPVARLKVAGAGDPRHERELRELADELGVADRVRWMGAVDDPAAVYAKADAVLFCVDWAEPFGLVPLEAMAVGRPVVATGTGGSGELLEHERNALLVPVGDPAAAASAVLRLAQDPELRATLRAGGEVTAGRLTQDAFCAAIADRAEAVAQAPRRRRG